MIKKHSTEVGPIHTWIFLIKTSKEGQERTKQNSLPKN